MAKRWRGVVVVVVVMVVVVVVVVVVCVCVVRRGGAELMEHAPSMTPPIRLESKTPSDSEAAQGTRQC